MKKLLLYTLTFSILFFQCHGSHKSPEEFLSSEISFSDMQSYYDGFMEYTQAQARLLQLLKLAKKAGSWIPFGSKIINNSVTKEAEKRGYNNHNQRLMCVAELALDENWPNRVAQVLLNHSEDHLSYLNGAHEKIRPIAENKSGTNEGFNEMLLILHEHHINKLQDRMGFNNTRKAQLIENNFMENGQYPLYNDLVAYKAEYGDYPPELILNMLLPYIYYKHRLLYERGARWN